MKKLSVRDLREYLKGRSHSDLVEDIAHLFKNFDAVREYYQLRIDGSFSDELIARYKLQIEEVFFPKRNKNAPLKLSDARQYITEYTKVADSPIGQVDLMLYYVEQGVRYTRQHGPINATFYNSLISMYKSAVEIITAEKMQPRFDARCRQLVKDTAGIGWGLHDTLTHTYYQHFKMG